MKPFYRAQDILGVMNALDLDSWKLTAIILGIISIAMFVVQRSSWMFLDVTFEVCIFHVPALIAVGVYLWLRRKPAAPVETVMPA